MKVICIFFLNILSLAVAAQKKLSGTVTDNKNKLLENVSVMLLKAKDSSLIKGTITNIDGKYSIESVNTGNNLLLFSKIGYKNIYHQLGKMDNGNEIMEIPAVVLIQEAKSLKEITITSRKPFIEQKLDRMIINIENSIISAGNTGLEVLEKLPGVSVDPNGGISLKGKAGVLIQIDGRPTNMSGDDLANLLRGMTAAQIDRIEIISNPSSKYDAAGTAGIINIRLKKDLKIGFNGTATLGYGQGLYAKYNGGLNVNYRNKRINLFGNYTISDRKGLTNMISERKFKNESELIADFIQSGKIIDHTTAQSLRAGADLFISKKTTFGIVLSGATNILRPKSNSQTIMQGSNGSLDSMLYTYSNNHSNWSIFSVNANFKHRFDSTGKELVIDVDYSSYNRNNNQFFRNTNVDASGNLKRIPDTLLGTLPALLKIASFEADYTHPLNSNSKIETGIKASHVSNDNDLAFYDQQGSGQQLDTALSNHFIYTENINAFYVNFSKEQKKWNYQAGIRGEQTITKGNQVTTAQKTMPRNYFQLFPTLFINFTPSEKHQVGFSYSRRIGRPSYNIVNPFKVFRDQYTYSEGNPLINPEFSNNFELNYVFNNIIIVGLGYGNTNNSMTFVVRQDDLTKTTIETYDNLAKLEDGALSVSANFKIAPWWSCNNFIGLFYNHFKGVFGNELVDNKGGIINISINHSIILPKNLIVEFGGFYLSRQPQGILSIAPQGNVSIGIQKQFLQKRATARFNISDVFHSQQWEKTTRFANIDATFKNSWDSRQARFSISWKFGKQTVPAERKHKNASEEEKKRVQLD